MAPQPNFFKQTGYHSLYHASSVGAPTAKAVLAHIERLRAVRDIGLVSTTILRVHRSRFAPAPLQLGWEHITHRSGSGYMYVITPINKATVKAACLDGWSAGSLCVPSVAFPVERPSVPQDKFAALS